LEQEGVEVRGEITDVDDLAEAPPVPSEILLKHTSPSLRSILRHFLKSSQNLYGETLIRLLDPKPADKSYAGGREEVIETLTQIGIPADSYVLSDGSGLSRYNFVSVDAMVRLLRYVYRQPYKDAFLDYLPLAGVDGTMSRRMQGTAAENNVRAKTGTLRHVRALSGYVLTRDGETLAFSMIVNNYTQPRRSAEYLQDLALEYLANLKR
jgi:D-alanyl-D-alanine carboxypeptidase/D-alanyl-D-alanine-endopeptidase (penicillin-binding protein 4)